MTFLAVLYTLLAGAIGAGFGYIFMGLLQGLLDLERRPYWLIGVVGGVLALVTLVLAWTPERETEVHLTIAQPDADQPASAAPPDPTRYVEALKRQDPALYAKIKASIRADLKAGKSQAIALANARDLLDDYIEYKLPYLSDDVIVERFQLLHDILSFLNGKDQNDICANLALGIKRSGVQLYLPQVLVDRDTENVTHIVTAARDEAAPKLELEKFKNLTNAAFAHSAETAGIDLEEVDTLLTGTGDPKKACMLMIGYFESVVSLSPSEAGPALRTLAAGEQSRVPATPPPPPPTPPALEPIAPAPPAPTSPSH